jgi:aryl-alcohol dehydrogenase-like predicted oxidoreductase
VKYGVAPAQIALAYLFFQPFAVFAVVAASKPTRLEDNLRAASLQLTSEEVRWLESGEYVALRRTE